MNGVSRVDVRSADGTSIAVFVDGEGPPLVMVHGSMSDHTTSGLLVEELRSEVTTFSIDRRGFGASGDADVYAIEREFQDVAAVVDAVAALTGEPVAVWGHSYGANCAMGGATLSANVHRLVLYEPSLGLVYEPDVLEAIEKKVAAGDLEGALLDVLVGIAGMTAAEVAAMRASTKMPWKARLATVPTLPRECWAEEEWKWQPGQFETIAAPTLLLTGALSPPIVTQVTERAAAAIPHARLHVIGGEGHFAHRNQPAVVAGIVLDFIRGSCRPQLGRQP
jgi:pimeloyl-ACP methyl ester carboxylesterase